MEPKKKGLDGSKAEIKTCRFCESEQITKFGFNSLKKRRKKRYGCKHCRKKFTPSEELEKPTKQG
jgi:transposase-like protein